MINLEIDRKTTAFLVDSLDCDFLKLSDYLQSRTSDVISLIVLHQKFRSMASTLAAFIATIAL